MKVILNLVENIQSWFYNNTSLLYLKWCLGTIKNILCHEFHHFYTRYIYGTVNSTIDGNSLQISKFLINLFLTHEQLIKLAK